MATTKNHFTSNLVLRKNSLFAKIDKRKPRGKKSLWRGPPISKGWQETRETTTRGFVMIITQRNRSLTAGVTLGDNELGKAHLF